ncbi:MAG: polysaccharide biosynthesis protein [Cytophagales bacterium]|nr:polysaccharide biosynthesis protein [Armatimonadota bacterium]
MSKISRRIVGQVVIDALLIMASNAAAFSLKYDPSGRMNPDNLTTATLLLPLLVGLRLLALAVFRLYRIQWRYVSTHDLSVIVGATTVSSFAFFGCLLFSGNGGRGQYSWGMQVLDWGINIFLLAGVRIGYRQLSEQSLLRGSRSLLSGHKAGELSLPVPPLLSGETDRRTPGLLQRALIIGAGDSGEAVARDLLRRSQDGTIPIGFVDDDPQKRRLQIHGLPVLGTTREIAEIVEREKIALILIAIREASGRAIRDILVHCEQTQARLCIIPSVGEMLEGPLGRHPGIRDIRIEDLLRRDPVRTDMQSIARYLSGQRVLITGAGGSIGAELCRQISALAPARLILVGQGENSVFEIEQELIREFNFAPIAVIADIKDRARMEEVFRRECPTVVFHAAAHKHVPLMEANPQEAVRNNVLGTRNVAELAAQYRVQKFIYVSTDKAVNPSSVMGASKRIGEMIVQSLAKTSETEFAAVRFGNVLGSRGSVIPTMRRQIALGGPVTVTDPQMTRYFMTIPEAVQLILQAGLIGGRGEIFVLDMGEPVRILDLARDLIRLSGYRPDRDIPIKITGARPGEKIFEELLYDEENSQRTTHEKIFVSNNNDIDPALVLAGVDRLARLARETDSPPEVLRAEILRLAHDGFAAAAPEIAVSADTARVPTPPRRNGNGNSRPAPLKETSAKSVSAP